MRWLCHIVPLSVVLALGLGGCARSHRAGDVEICPLPPRTVCCTPGGILRSPELGCPLTCPPGTSLTRFEECHSPRPTDPFLDGGPPGGPDSAVLTCPEVRGLAACFDDIFVEAGRPFDLPVIVDPCACENTSLCDVEVVTGDRRGEPTLRLTTYYCEAPIDCEVCAPAEASCPVPARRAASS